jgi:phosphoglucosamine mutase
VFRELGAEVVTTGVEPDGFNINRDSGSTVPDTVRKLVCRTGADIGIAFDGDADRVILVDAKGNLVDGDGILYLLSQERQTREPNSGVVGTQMTNLGVEIACAQSDIPFVRANVGDRYVLEELLAREWTLGGEPSGHILCLERSTTGDGLVAALAVLEVMASTQRTLEELVSGLTIFPQKMINVPISQDTPPGILQNEQVTHVVRECERELADKGRVVLRPSGTEPVVRVMVEGNCEDTVDRMAKKIASILEKVGSGNRP